MRAADLYARMATLSEEGRSFVIATIIEAKGSSPRGVGAKILVEADGATVETIGGGILEARVIADARLALASGISHVQTYRLSDQGEHALGSLCGGEVRVFLEVHECERSLLIVGAGHVGQSLCRCAKLLDYRVTVVDSRAEMLTKERLPEADELITAEPDQISRVCPIAERTSVVIVTHGHLDDEEALFAAAGSRAAYVGMIGSSKKVQKIMANLAGRGVSADRLERVRAPIGLDIGAQTPAELALAIMAEVVAHAYGKFGEGAAIPVARTVAAST